MTPTNNIIDIYEHLYKASDNLAGENIEYITGFQNAVYILSMALKNYDHINLHIENRRLSRELDTALWKAEEASEDKHIVYKRNRELKEENLILAKQLHKIKSPSIKAAIGGQGVMYLAEINYRGNSITFYINTNQEQFMEIFNAATIHVETRHTKKVHVHLSTIKCWYIEYYRSKGFTCIPN